MLRIIRLINLLLLIFHHLFIFGSEQTSIVKIVTNESESINRSINLIIESNIDIYGIQFDLHYNPNELILSKNEIISNISGINVYSKARGDGLLQVLLFNMDGGKILDINKSNIGNILSIHFIPIFNFHGISQVEFIDIILAGKGGEEVSISSTMFDITFDSPQFTSLTKIYPNPFNSSTTINYQLYHAELVTIIIYNNKNEKVSILVNEIQDPNYYQIIWDGKNDNGDNVKAGRYSLTMTAKGYHETIMLTLLK